MIRGGPPSYHFPIEHCVIFLYTNVKICVKVFTTNHSAGKHDRGPFFRLIRSRLTGSI